MRIFSQGRKMKVWILDLNTVIDKRNSFSFSVNRIRFFPSSMLSKMFILLFADSFRPAEKYSLEWLVKVENYKDKK